jgi:hypothetical protein
LRAKIPAFEDRLCGPVTRRFKRCAATLFRCRKIAPRLRGGLLRGGLLLLTGDGLHKHRLLRGLLLCA